MKKFLALLLSAMMVLSCFAGITFTVSAEDAENGNWIVDLTQCNISGHNKELVGPTGHAQSGAMAAAGLPEGEKAALLHAGAIGLGEVDLSKYSKVIITYTSDAGESTVAAHASNANNRIMLTNADSDNKMSPDEGTIVASTAHVLPADSWKWATAEIDLSNVNDTTNAYITVDFLPGWFWAVRTIEFVAAAPSEGGDDNTDEPVYEDKILTLGKGGQGAPYSGEKTFGQRFTVPEGDALKQINIYNVATYTDGNVNKWSFKVWQWDIDYATTVIGTPLYEMTGENHTDCAPFVFDIDPALAITGDIYYELEYLEGSQCFTGWTATDGPADGVETYVAGNLMEGTTYVAHATVYGPPSPPDPNETSTECLFAYDFGIYSEDIVTDMGIKDINLANVTSLTNSGYVTLESLGGDPYFAFSKSVSVPSTQSDYVVIKYRTSTHDAKGEIYIARTDGLNYASPMEKTHVDFDYIADGQWHTLMIDASGVWGDSKIANLTNLRFDFLKAEGTVDVAYIKFFATLEGAEACIASETKEVHVSGEYIEGADGVIIVGGQAYSADKWIKLSAGGNAATQTFAGNIGNLAICADEVRYTVDGTLTKWCTQEAFKYMESVSGKIVDAEGAYDSISFRGWARPNVGDIDIDMYGYAINDGEPVFDASFWLDEPSLREPNAAGAGAERFENIEIPTADLANGVYNIYLLMKDTNGVIYCMNENFGGTIQYVKGSVADSEYPYTDAEGNGYTARADGVLFDADGFDTGLRLFIDDFGTPYGVGHYFALTYQNPWDGSVNIDGVNYSYTTQVTLAPKMEPVLPEDTSVVPESLPANIGGMSPDTLFVKYQGEGEVSLKDGGAHEYIANVMGGKILDIDKNMEYFALRGWTKDDAGQQNVAEYGYQLNDMEPVWSSDWVTDGSDINGVFEITYGSRYKIVINVTGLADGIYNVYPLVKHADGSIAYLNVWGNFQYVKGGSWNQVGYTDGTNTYLKAEDGSVTINDEAATGKMLITDNGAIYYDGLTNLDEAGDAAKGKYLYDVTLTYTETPEIPVNPAELKPVYIVDGEALNTTADISRAEAAEYDYDNGYITYTSTGGDPNVGNYFVPAGTVLGRYMVLKYRTTSEGAKGEVFVGKGGGASGDSNVPYPAAYTADGEWHTMIVDLGISKDYDINTNVANHFRNDFVQEKDQSIDIEYYAFFNTLKEAKYYAENDMHVLPKAPVYYTITFVADGETVKEITILEGTTTIKAPAVPEKEGYTGAWEEYTITGDADQTINAVYTEIEVTNPPDEYTPEDPYKLTSFPKDVFENIFASPNQTELIFNDDGSVTFKGTWTETTSPMDPYVAFNYGNFLRKYVDNKLQNVANKNGEYSVLVLKVKMDESVAGNFLMHYAMGRGGMIDGTLVATPDYDAEGTGDYEYIIFDMSYTAFTEDVINVLRFDWVDNNPTASAENVGASMTLYEICLYKDMDEALAACGMEVPTDPPKDTDDETDPPVEPVETDPQETEPTTEPEDEGCKSVIASASLMTVVAAACAAVALRKKKED